MGLETYIFKIYEIRGMENNGVIMICAGNMGSINLIFKSDFFKIGFKKYHSSTRVFNDSFRKPVLVPDYY